MTRAAAASATTASPPQLTIYASGATTVGLQVWANASISGATSPTGTLTFRLFGPFDATCSTSPFFTSTVALSGTSASSDRYWTTIAGTYHWEVQYSGDAVNSPAGPTSCATSTASVVVSKFFATAFVTANAPANGTIRAAAAVNGYNPTGSVTLYLSPPGDTFCSTTVFTSTVSVNGSANYLSAPYTPTAGGVYKWRATYSGDTNNMMVPFTSCLDPGASVTVPTPYATFTYPSPGQSNVDTTVPFTWGGVAAAQGYRLLIGTTPQGFDLVSTPVLPTSQTSYLVPAMPPGKTLYASLYTELNGSWAGYQAITFTAAAGRATFTYPLDGQTNVDTTTPFTWQQIPQAQGYFVTVGSTFAGSDLVWSGGLPASQSSLKVAALPAGTMYATIYTEVNGVWYSYQAITFTAIPTEAGFTNPTSGQANVDPTSTFTWTTVAAVAGVQGYAVWVSTVYGSANLYNSGVLPVTQASVTPPPLPAGQTLYVLLLTERNGVWSNQAITIATGPTASGTATGGPGPPLLVGGRAL